MPFRDIRNMLQNQKGSTGQRKNKVPPASDSPPPAAKKAKVAEDPDQNKPPPAAAPADAAQKKVPYVLLTRISLQEKSLGPPPPVAAAPTKKRPVDTERPASQRPPCELCRKNPLPNGLRCEECASCIKCLDNRSDLNCTECSCQVCYTKTPDKDHLTLMCDTCEYYFHTYCLDPPLAAIPDEDWFCPLCKSDEDEVVEAEEPSKSTKGKGRPKRAKKEKEEVESGSDDEYTPGMEVDKEDEEDDTVDDNEDDFEEDDDDFVEVKESTKKVKKKPAAGSAFAAMMRKANKHFTPAVKKKRASGGGRPSLGGSRVDPATLPVLVKPQDMFDDLCLNYKPFGEFCQKLGRPLRVATMCSGTESPMLALGMMAKAVEAQTGYKLEIAHIFSCEIEPFKQAYIERNFSPPLLFRDIRELGNTKATTAYGGLATVPGECDLLVAGTSCVDYSNLNNEKKGLDDGGESGQTFTGMMNWVDRTQPPVVILENVEGAPWQLIAERWRQHGYVASFMSMDAKYYYIPHTRQRKYLVAVRQGGPVKHTQEGRHKSRKFGRTEKDCPSFPQFEEDWQEGIKRLQRPANPVLEAFLFPNDDPRVMAARHAMAGKRGSRDVDWQRCESRHGLARDKEGLGQKRPLTNWDTGGAAQLHDHCWKELASSQVERVLDLMDINYLRQAQKGVDINYKTAVWNLSQNVDRETGSSKPGICPCLTPSGVPYVTNRGGAVIGLEALSLQGIPVDDLILTRESDDNMKDLAGNAMACTVVGSCIAHSLVLAMKHNVFELPEKKKVKDGEKKPDVVPATQGDAQSFSGEDNLVKSKVAVSTGGAAASADLAGLIAEARRSSRMCVCEGRSAVAAQVLACAACGHTACVACAGRPEHEYGSKKVTPSARVTPSDFLARLKDTLPMVVRFDCQAHEYLDGCKPAEGCDAATWSGWCAALTACLEGEFKFESCTRTEIWIIKYQGVLPSGREASLELHLDGEKRSQWLLWCKAVVVGEEVNKKWVKEKSLRAALATPLARMVVDARVQKGLLDGKWQLHLPVQASGSATITGKGPKTETWQRKIGLKNGWEGTERFMRLSIVVDKDGDNLGLNGDYVLHPKCGTAQASLHSCEATGLHLFLDPTRCGPPTDDFYVIADSHRRLGYGESRGERVAFDTEWRAEKLTGKPTKVRFSIQGKWAPTPPEAIKLSEIEKHGSSIAAPKDRVQVEISGDSCVTPVTVLKAELPLSAGGELRHWPLQPAGWRTLDLQRSKATFESFNWFKPVLTIPKAIQDWTAVPSISGDFAPDPRCAPAKPSLQWHRISGNKLEPRENQLEAAQYERALKARPDAFVVQMRRDGDTGGLRVGVNPSSLIHRARANLPGASQGEVTASWRVAEHSDLPLEKLPSFKFTSCKANEAHEQPPHFRKYKLRPEQQRSLGWMLAQEASDGVFMEEEATESVLAPLKWRAEARVRRKVVARGGIVADQVGYGKTAITVGLIDCSPDTVPGDGLSAEELSGKQPVHATLIIVPSQLMGQWPKEIKKFTGDALKVVTIKTMTDLNQTTVADVEAADVVMITNNILNSNLYFPRLARLAGGKEFPAANKGRLFQQIYRENCEKLRARVRQLQEEGSKRALSSIEEDLAKIDAEGALESDVGAGLGNTAKRLSLGKGKKATYRAEKAAKKKKRVSEDSDDDEEEESTPAKKVSKKDDPDPWELGASRTRKDWRHMRCPPLFELFAWKRVVTDEFTYLEGNQVSVVNSVTAKYKWALSGTPPTDSFQDLKSVAALLGIHLGVDESTATSSSSREFKELQKQMTKSEQFQVRMELRTPAWHRRRHALAQRFMDCYVRQNIAEIDEILADEKVVNVTLTPAERAVYLELDHHLQAMEMKTKKMTKSKASTNVGDRESRLREILGASGSAEEALLKQAAHFDLLGNAESAEMASEEMVRVRERQLETCERDLLQQVERACEMKAGIMHDDPNFEETRFSGWVKNINKQGKDEGCGDEEAARRLKHLVEKGMDGHALCGAKPTKRRKGEEAERAAWDLREHCHGLRRLQKELVARLRSLRYFKAVRDMQVKRTAGAAASAEPGLDSCASCGRERHASSAQWAVLSCCGHQGCHGCLVKSADMQECPVSGCAAPARPSAVVRCSELGCDEEHEAGGKYGSKLKRVIQTIKAAPSDDRILVFVQFPDLMQVVAACLRESGINAVEVKGSVHKRIEAIDKMQEKGGPRVALLNLADASASGANLQTCNHAIFVHPMLAESQQEYTQSDTQAIGRIRRYGQEKKVHIWRFICEDTVDATIYEQRNRDWDDAMKQ